MYDMLDSSRRLKQHFIDGVYEFVSKAIDRPSNTQDGGIRCPCMRCICQKILQPSQVRAHLLQYGFQANYHIWVYHGEDRQTDDNLGYASTSYDNMQFQSVTVVAYDAYMQVADITTHYEHVENQGMHEGESPNSEAQKFYDMLASANELVFAGAAESRLSIAIRLLANRMNWHTTQKALDDFMQLVLNIAPRENSIPKNYYEVKKIVSTLGLKSVKIDCC